MWEDRNRRRRGHTLVEVMTVATILVILASLAAPSFRRAIEQSKADIAGANLRAIWAAERLYWLKYRHYTKSVAELQNTQDGEQLLDPKIPSPDSQIDPKNPPPYLYSIRDASDNTFQAEAVRTSYGNSTWVGSFVIDQFGEFGNPQNYFVSDSTLAVRIVPGFR